MIFDAVPTEAQMLEGMSTREQEVWYITQHFNDLQGLRTAPIAAGLLLTVYLVPRGYKDWEHALLIFAGLLSFAILWNRWILGCYRKHYGLVVPATMRQPEMQLGHSVAYCLIFVIGIGCTIALRGSFVPIWMLSMAKTFCLQKCFFPVPVNFAIQLRRVLYMAGMFIATGSVLYLTYTRLSSIFAVIYVGLWSSLLLSLYDHWLLGYCARSDMRFSTDDLPSSDPELFPDGDQLVHESARLAIFTVLVACKGADFLFLERMAGLSRSIFLVQMSRLEEAGLIEIEEKRKRTLITAALTGRGRAALEAYWRTMEELRAGSQELAP